jgi:hypothetical protein
MSTEHVTQALQKVRELASITSDPGLKSAIDVLGDAISVGNISNSTGVAIGRNIRMVVNQLNLPAGSVAALLDVRNALGSVMGLDPDRYRLAALLEDKTRDFVGRAYVFDAIGEFLNRNRSGYFVVVADPGLGKSAILAEYLRRTGCIAHFNVRAAGISTAKQFLENVCTQIIVDFGLQYASLPADTCQDGVRLSKLLVEAAAKLSAGERLVIAVDALDEVDLTGHPGGANILYLPKSLPDGVYFLLTRRDVDLPIVFDTPQALLNLMTHPAQNREDVEFYLRRIIDRSGVKDWINRQNLSTAVFVTELARLSENNFMYLHYVIPAIEEGNYASLDIRSLPAGLQGYYEDHWRRMGMAGKPTPRVKIRIVYIMCEVRESVSRAMVAEFATDQDMKIDELSVQEVFDEWKEFIHMQTKSEGPRYSIYHASFRDFLHRKEVVQAAGITIKGVNALIAKNLWNSVFGTPAK